MNNINDNKKLKRGGREQKKQINKIKLDNNKKLQKLYNSYLKFKQSS